MASNGFRKIPTSAHLYFDTKTLNFSGRLSPPRRPRRGTDTSFIQVGHVARTLKSPRQSSTRTATYRLYLGSNCRTEAHKRTSDLGTSLLNIWGTTLPRRAALKRAIRQHYALLREADRAY